MLSLSTAYNINRCRSWSQLLAEVNALGFSCIELNVEFPEEWFTGLSASVEKGDVSVSSLHNYCPRLTALPEGETMYSAYNLASTDADERNTAIAYTRKTIEHASRFSAAVVIHAGYVPVHPSGRDLFVYAARFGVNAKLFSANKDAVLRKRQEKRGPFLEALKKSLDAILSYAAQKKVRVGLENRMYCHELPSLEEIPLLLDTFAGAPLYYWHDTGHAEVSVRLGLVSEHAAYLRLLSPRMLGTHLHDLDAFSDHRAPGTGDFDFKVLTSYVKNDTIKVIEAHATATDTEIKQSIKHLQQIGLA